MKDKKKRKIEESVTVDSETLAKYSRGNDKPINPNRKFKALKKTLESFKKSNFEAANLTATTEILLPQDAGTIEFHNEKNEYDSKIYRLKQADILKNVDLNTSAKAFDLHLTHFGPYTVKYSRNGRFMLLAGRCGHIGAMDCLRSTLGAELQLEDEVHDVQYLHNELLFAAAQSQFTYIYDSKGVEVHCLRDSNRVYKLDFLPYHYLLNTVGHSGVLKWRDISIGEIVASHSTGQGPCKIMRHNPQNAVTHLGHSNGTVTLWCPSANKALVSMLCHKTPLTDLCIDRDGKYMTTAGYDGLLKIWDLRTYQCLHAYKTDHPVVSIDISDTGLIGLGLGRQVQILKNAFLQPNDVTYLKHSIKPPPKNTFGAGAVSATKALESSVSIQNIRFRPYEDVLSVGHSYGVSTLIVPGSGEPNFDSFEVNPFMNPKQRREAEIQSLLQKLAPDMIGLDSSFVGTVDRSHNDVIKEQHEIFHVEKTDIKQEKNRKRGRNKISAKLARKQKNVIDSQTIKLQQKLQEQREKQQNERAKQSHHSSQDTDMDYDPLNRFKKKTV